MAPTALISGQLVAPQPAMRLDTAGALVCPRRHALAAATLWLFLSSLASRESERRAVLLRSLLRVQPNA